MTNADRIEPKGVSRWPWDNSHDVDNRDSLPSAVRDANLAADQK